MFVLVWVLREGTLFILPWFVFIGIKDQGPIVSQMEPVLLSVSIHSILCSFLNLGMHPLFLDLSLRI